MPVLPPVLASLPSLLPIALISSTKRPRNSLSSDGEGQSPSHHEQEIPHYEHHVHINREHPKSHKVTLESLTASHLNPHINPSEEQEYQK